MRLLLVYTVLALPLVVWGASRALEANNNSPIDWVTSAFGPRAEYDRHCEQFGPGDTVMISWPGCTTHESSLDQFVEVLRTAHVFYKNDHWLFDRVASGREVVKLLVNTTRQGGQPVITLPDATRRVRSHLVGPDGVTTAVVITFNAEGLKQRKRLVDLIRQAAHEICHVPLGELHLAGPVIDGLSVDNASQATLSKYAGPSAVVVFLLCWLNLRSYRAALVVFGLAMLCQGAALALVHYSGESMSALLIVLPPLIQVLAVAGGVHLTNYYFDLESEGTTAQRIVAAVREGWLPCTLSAGTTAIGMASLMTSQLEPIRAFGGYSAAGVLLTVGVLLGLLPACYLHWPPGKGKKPARTFALPWNRWAVALRRMSTPIVVGGLVLVAVGGWYASRITTSVRIETMFAADHRVIEDYKWLETHIGPLVPLEVTLSFDSSSPLSYRDKLALLWDLGAQLETDDALTNSLSAANFFPPIPQLSSLSLEQQNQVIEPIIRESVPYYQQLGLLSIDEGVEHWRLTTRTSALGSADYGVVLDRVSEVVDQQLRGVAPTSQRGLSSNTTGIMPLVHAIQGQLLMDLLVSFAASLALITMVMILVQAGVFAGLLAMIPNVFPLALFFGYLGWRGEPIDIGVMMTASVALGVAVDDTLHFLTFFQRGVLQYGDRGQAVQHALQHCGPAIIQTSVSCGLGLLVFALSDFLPTSRFAISIATLLALALVGDMVLLPALLLSPLGKICARDTLAGSDVDSSGCMRQPEEFIVNESFAA